MLSIDFGNAGGGLRNFRDTDALKAHLMEERGKWHSFASGPEAPQTSEQLKQLGTQWGKSVALIDQALNSYPGDPGRVERTIQQHVTSAMLIEFDGREGCAIRDIAVQMGVDAANGAIRYLKASSGEQIFQTATRAQIEGTLTIWALQNALDRESSASARDAARRLVKQTSEIAQQHHAHLEEVEAKSQERAAAIRTRLGERP